MFSNRTYYYKLRADAILALGGVCKKANCLGKIPKFRIQRKDGRRSPLNNNLEKKMRHAIAHPDEYILVCVHCLHQKPRYQGAFKYHAPPKVWLVVNGKKFFQAGMLTVPYTTDEDNSIS